MYPRIFILLPKIFLDCYLLFFFHTLILPKNHSSGSNKITPYLENIGSGDSVPNSQNRSQSTSNVAPSQKSPHVRRAKWHLGIRSQSRPGIYFKQFSILEEKIGMFLFSDVK